MTFLVPFYVLTKPKSITHFEMNDGKREKNYNLLRAQNVSSFDSLDVNRRCFLMAELCDIWVYRIISTFLEERKC